MRMLIGAIPYPYFFNSPKSLSESDSCFWQSITPWWLTSFTCHIFEIYSVRHCLAWCWLTDSISNTHCSVVVTELCLYTFVCVSAFYLQPSTVPFLKLMIIYNYWWYRVERLLADMAYITDRHVMLPHMIDVEVSEVSLEHASHFFLAWYCTTTQHMSHI